MMKRRRKSATPPKPIPPSEPFDDAIQPTVHFYRPIAGRDGRFARWVIRPFSRYTHCALEIEGAIFDFRIGGALWVFESADLRHEDRPPAITLFLPEMPVYDAPADRFGLIGYNCATFIATALGMPDSRTVVTPDRLLRRLEPIARRVIRWDSRSTQTMFLPGRSKSS